VGPVIPEDLVGGSPGLNTADARKQVRRAREQKKLCSARNGNRLNAELGPEETMASAGLRGEAMILLKNAAHKLQLSARAIHRAIRVARTIADLHGSDRVRSPDLAEALRYRPRA
jgi:magnesium chelatase family protein